VPLGEWVLYKACNQAVAWHRSGLDNLKMSVNISSLQFRQQDFVKIVEQALETSGMPPGLLELEMTESSIMQQIEETISDLNQLKEIGLQLSIDDFGTGYSSMSYLKRFPLDTLKIDRSFVKDLSTEASDAAIVKATIALAKSLELTTIAEGVEDKIQLEFLRRHQCDIIQGYYFSRPLPADQAESIISLAFLPAERTAERGAGT